MIPVVLDTNVLVSALLATDEAYAQTLTCVVGHPEAFRLVVSSQIADEYRDVCGRSLITLRGLSEEADALIALVLDLAEEVVPKAIPALVYPDVKDKPFVEAAVYVDGVLITNNTRDFRFIGLRAMRAGDFLRFAEKVFQGGSQSAPLGQQSF